MIRQSRHLAARRILVLLLMLVMILSTGAPAAAATTRARSGGAEPNYSSNTANYRGKVLADSVDMMKVPYKKGEVSGATVVVTLKKDQRVTVTQTIVNHDSSETYWLGVKATVNSTNYTGYIPFMRNSNGDNMLKPCYTEDCTKEVCYADLTAAKASSINSAPCAPSTDDSSEKVATYAKGDKMVATQLLKNLAGNYWYKVSYTSGSSTITGYAYAGDVTAKPRYNVTASGVTKYPKGVMEYGQALTLNGKVTSTTLPMTKVGAFVYEDNATSGTAETGKWTTVNKTSFSIEGTDVDNNCKIGSLAKGVHTYTIKAKVVNNWATSGTTKTSETKTFTVFSNTFSVGVTTYTISYNANGGSGAPGSQLKEKGKTLTLSSTKPTRSARYQDTYIVYLNPNGGSCSVSSLTSDLIESFSFTKWNTKSDGSGTSYSPGGSYTANANATLYAQWKSTFGNTAVTLPTPTRSGYTFKGWNMSSAASSGVTGTYVPNGNVNLYAIWEKNAPQTYTVSYSGNGGSGAPAAQTKVENVTLTLSSTKPSRSNAAAGSYKVTLDANGGTCDIAALITGRTTSYTFKNWNTRSDGSGTSYASGGSYTANASVTLYAQWNETTTAAPVQLPTPTRSGYTFKGWGTSSTASSGKTGSYTPTANVTLYAVWEKNAEPATAGWKKIDGKWKYQNADGSYATGWKKVSGTWYYFDANGWMKTGWVKVSGAWYYLKPSGAMATGWIKLSGVWYYLKSSGEMATGWLKIGNDTYYFKSSGAMAANEWCGGWWLNANGTWTYPAKAAWKSYSKGWRYEDSAGNYPTNASVKIDDKYYTFDANGYWVP